MLRKLRSRLTYANVASTLALVLAVGGGTAYAATKIGTSSIRRTRSPAPSSPPTRSAASKVKNQSLSGTDIRDSSITRNDVRNGSLLATDFAANQLPAGPKGDPGAPATSIFGVVTADGGLTTGKGVTAMQGAAGVYTATINQDVSACAVVATLRGGDNGNIVAASRPAARRRPRSRSRRARPTRPTPRAFQFAVYC